MQVLKREINELLVKEGKLKTESYRLQKEKKSCYKMILGISDAINNEDKNVDINLLDEYRRKNRKYK